MKRTLVIGDCHGGLKALEEVFRKASVSLQDKLIFLGDYVDGWSESAQLINYLIRLSAGQECVFLKGNHDIWCEEWLDRSSTDVDWLIHGGQSTIRSYSKLDLAAREKHLQFFKE